MTQNLILDKQGIERTLKRLAHEILERNTALQEAALIGIRTGGAHLAARLREEIRIITGSVVPLGILDITLYRDDLTEIGAQPEIRGTELDFDVGQRIIVLIDDVLFTGRTIRSAIDQIIDFGRPKCIQLAVLIDRGHRELPIRADFVGKNVPTSLEEEVRVELREEGMEDRVIVRKRGSRG